MRKSFCVNHTDKVTILTHAIEDYEKIMINLHAQDFGVTVLGLRIEGDRVIVAWNSGKKAIEFYNYRTNKLMKICFEVLKSKELDCLLYSICALSYGAVPEIPDNPPIDKNKIYTVER